MPTARKKTAAGRSSKGTRRTAQKRRRSAVRQFDGQILKLDDCRIPLVYRQDARARTIILRFDRELGHLVVVLPKRATLESGRRFAMKNRDWILDNAARLPRPVPFAAGRVIPFLGQPHRIRHWPTARGVVWLADGEIHVAGHGEHLARRVHDWLKIEARREINRRAHEKAALLGKSIRRVTLKDTKTRWGSCSPTGCLSFTWRLIFAPPHVIDYVVAHEVAHMKELNHSPRFWRVVAQLTRHEKSARHWLQTEGLHLHRYGRE
jgi:predicted metal-dependent hydrolase